MALRESAISVMSLFLMCGTVWGQDAAHHYDFYPAGDSPGSYFTIPLSLSGRHTVGYYETSGANNAYVQTDKSFADAAPSGSITSYLSAINQHGVAVGGYCTAAGGCGPEDGAHAFTYQVKTGKIRSFDFPLKGAATTAYGINDKGVIVGGYCQNALVCPQGSFNPANHGFVDDHGVFTTLDFPNAQGTSAFAINGAGTIVGYYVINNNGPHAFIYENGVFSTIDFPGSGYTIATGINNHGVVAGLFSNSTGVHGYTYHNGKFTQIDRPGAVSTAVTGIDDRNGLVGVWNPPLGQKNFKAVWEQEAPDRPGPDPVGK